jgi:hypothetical protein
MILAPQQISLRSQVSAAAPRAVRQKKGRPVIALTVLPRRLRLDSTGLP